MNEEDISDLTGGADMKSLLSRYHEERGILLITVGKLHLAVDAVSRTFFNGDIQKAGDFLHTVTGEAFFPPGSPEDDLADKLGIAVRNGRITQQSSAQDIIAVMNTTMMA